MKLDAADWRAGMLMFKTSDPEAIRFAREFKPGEYEFKEHKEKRSKDANAYMWVLCSLIAEKLIGVTKEDIYRRAIKHGNVFKDFALNAQETATFRVAWEMLGTGWLTEQVDYDANGDKVITRAYFGSSVFNSRQMSRLIEDLKADAQALGIETLSDRELSLLIEDWGKKYDQRVWH